MQSKALRRKGQESVYLMVLIAELGILYSLFCSNVRPPKIERNSRDVTTKKTTSEY